MPPETPVIERDAETKAKTRRQPRYKVILLNDDVTTFEFVTHLLITLFHKDATTAKRLTQEVHDTGSALITVTTLERAELYLDQIRSLARPQGFPLTATMEPA